MKILLITDVHHGDNTNYKHLKGEEYINLFGEEFREASKKLITEMDQCDLVINLGDLIHDEDGQKEKDLQTYKEAVSFFATSAKVEHILGNHDVRNLTLEDLSSVIGRNTEYCSFDIGGYHHVIIGGNRKEPRNPYLLSEEELQWLEKDLKSTELPAIIYSHFPLGNQDQSGNYYFANRPEAGSMGNKGFIRQVLERSGKVKAAFNGHTHFFHKEIIKDIIYCTIPSFSENDGTGRPNHQYALINTEGESIDIEIKSV